MQTDNLFQAPDDPSCVRIVPLGGCGEFGMNLTAYLHAGRLFVVDCGLRFPDPIKLGTDAVIPRVDEWFGLMGGVYAYIITHGHEDHIGALPFVVQKWPAPIYATRWTAELLKNKFAKYGIDANRHPITLVEAGDRVRAEGFEAEYVHVNHSIPMACALLIRTPELTIFHTGDFKFDAAPIGEAPINFEQLRQIGDEGVDLLLADSTNAEKSGGCPGEAGVAAHLFDVFKTTPGAAVLSTFSSNLWRLMTAIDVFRRLGRKVFIAGMGMETTLAVAKATELYYPPEGVLINEDQLDKLPRERLAVLATGCQGEFRSAMMRIAYGEHRAFSVHPGDTVTLSSRIIPGNEKSVINLVNNLRKRGATVITTRENPGIHVSGHAYGGDIEQLATLLRPKHFLPVHGAFGQLHANLVDIARQPSTTGDSLLIETGDVIDAKREGLTLKGQIEVGLDFIDSDSGVVLSHEILRERLRIGELGGAFLSGVYSKTTGEWLKQPEIYLQGILLPPEVDIPAWLQKTSTTLGSLTKELVRGGNYDSDAINEEARIILRRHLAAMLNKKPVVISKLHFV